MFDALARAGAAVCFHSHQDVKLGVPAQTRRRGLRSGPATSTFQRER